jgi:hypothetical protein
MSDINSRRRIIINKKIQKEQWPSLFHRTAGNYDALIIPPDIFFFLMKKKSDFIKIAERNNMAIEAGYNLSRFIPRRLFLLHRDMFRMASGRRKLRYNFCPTNPQTIEYLKKQAAKLFSELIQGMSREPVFHLWPDRENAWCSCPACRAFSLAEQNLIAVNSVADALAKINPAARLSYQDLSENSPDSPGTGITARSNTFVLKSVPPFYDEKRAQNFARRF